MTNVDVQGLTPVLFALAAAQIAAERRIVRQLRLAGATTAERTEVRTRGPLARWKLRRLLSVQAIATAVPDRYFLDERAYDRWRQVRRRRAIAVVAFIVLVTVAAWGLGSVSDSRF